MAEGDRSTLFSKTDNDSVLSGSICYPTELSEDDEMLSEAASEASLLLHMKGAVHPYLFKPEWSSSELDSETLDIVDLGKSKSETQTGTRMMVLCVINTRSL